MNIILMTEEYWANSQLSIARYCGGIKISGIDYIIVNKEGKDLFECSIEAEREGREKAIEPGEPADLIRADFKPFYRKLGRDKFIAVLEENSNASIEEMKRIMKGASKYQTNYENIQREISNRKAWHIKPAKGVS